MHTQRQHDELFNKIKRLTPDKIAFVDDFVEFLSHRDETDSLISVTGKLSEKSFRKAWDNPEDAEYDNL